ncbi:hypothetical protein TOK_0149 [Pseudonocardia sp. N23]|nr:hypothetical protein TOK_0149 [Pseudonocardia sp. N23]
MGRLLAFSDGVDIALLAAIALIPFTTSLLAEYGNQGGPAHDGPAHDGPAHDGPTHDDGPAPRPRTRCRAVVVRRSREPGASGAARTAEGIRRRRFVAVII